MFENSHHKKITHNGEESQKYEHLKGNDVEHLTDELAELIEAATNGQCDITSIDTHLDALDEIAPLTIKIDEESSYDAFMEKHAEEMGRTPTHNTVSNPRVPEKKHFHKMHRLVAFAAIVVILICTMALANTQSNNLFDAIAQWTSEIFGFEKESSFATIKTNPLAEGESASFDSLKDALSAFGITAPLAPQYVPNRFSLEKVIATNKAGNIVISALYSADDELLKLRYNQTTGTDFRDFEKDGSVTTLFDCGGISHFLIADKEKEKACWQNGEFECCITGNVTKEELKEIINSIY